MNRVKEGERWGLTPSIPLSARDCLVTAIAVRGEGEESVCSLPWVEEVASYDLFYPGLSIWSPYRYRGS